MKMAGVLLFLSGIAFADLAHAEIYRWTDGTNSHVTCEFANGKLVKWTLSRPPAPDEGSPAP